MNSSVSYFLSSFNQRAEQKLNTRGRTAAKYIQDACVCVSVCVCVGVCVLESPMRAGVALQYFATMITHLLWVHLFMNHSYLPWKCYTAPECVCVCVHESVCVCVCLSASVWECASVFLCSSVCVFLCWLVSL